MAEWAVAMTNTTLRSYSELVTFETFEERFDYLKLGGVVGKNTFGFDRYLNQLFYKSQEWFSVRKFVILRDSTDDDVCDLGIFDRPIFGRVLIHHMNPITADDIIHRSSSMIDPEFLIAVSHNTHQAIHYSDKSIITPSSFVERSPNDTAPWLTTKRSDPIEHHIHSGFSKRRPRR